jgi:hypothetical protein
VDIRPRAEGNATARRNPTDSVDMVVIALIVVAWFVIALLVLGLCATAADGDRALGA